MDTTAMTDITPMIMPSEVSRDRNPCARMDSSADLKLSSSMNISVMSPDYVYP